MGVTNKDFFMLKAAYHKIKKLWSLARRRLVASPEEAFAVEKYCARHSDQRKITLCAAAMGMSPLKVWQSLRRLSFSQSCGAAAERAPDTTRPCGKVYFKTTFYAPQELPFIKMNLLESLPYVDTFIIVEGNRTHVGAPHEFIFEKFITDIPQNLRKKILYIKADLANEVVDCTESRDGSQMHENENVL